MADKANRTGAIVAGIAGLTAAAIGAYYLYGHENAEKNRAKVKAWMLKAKGDVLEELENVQGVTESAYMNAVNLVAQKYRELKTIDVDELEDFIREMRDHWRGIKKTIETKAPRAKKNAKSAAKQAVKTAKKPAKKVSHKAAPSEV